MGSVGQKERETQNRVVRLFCERLGYDYLGDWQERPGNRNIDEQRLRAFLNGSGRYSHILIDRAIDQFLKTTSNQVRELYDINKDVYRLLRYGVKTTAGIGELHETVWLIDWQNPDANHFAIAEEVTITDCGGNTKRPDIVLYLNGIAIAVLELKRSTVSISEGIRQNIDSQKPEFIQRFFTTVQLLLAGNDSEGLRYGTIGTPEKHYLRWKEPGTEANPLDRELLQLCARPRLLEILHDFIVYDAGRKKPCRPNQYFGVKAAQTHIRQRQGGIIWHTQGSGKSLTMVWLAKWIRENVPDARVLIVTDRTELDEQIENTFYGVEEHMHRVRSGAALITALHTGSENLLCALVHKFGRNVKKGKSASKSGKGNAGPLTDDDKDTQAADAFVAEMQRALPPDFRVRGDLYVFVDECHRTQSGKLHQAMKALMPNAMFIGFTGTPLLHTDKKTTLETFGPFIHTYKYDEAVTDGVVLDLLYEARNVPQFITAQDKIDQWFEAKTQGLNDIAKATLKQRWGTMQKVLSSHDVLSRIVADIVLDLNTKPRLCDGRGNALLVAESIYAACKFYELFEQAGLKENVAIVTSYTPNARNIKGEDAGEGETERLHQYKIYRRMLAEWFNEDEQLAIQKTEQFEKEAKQRFIREPARLRLLIVVDKLLTGFDAPSATYLYINKPMRDHGLFQAICRVNRLDGDDKRYGYVIDYRDLFRSLETAIRDYTSGAFDGYDREDVNNLLGDRLEQSRERLDTAREALAALCEDVPPPKDADAFRHYFCSTEPGDAQQLQANEPRRIALYRACSALLQAYAEIANELPQAGYTDADILTIRAEVTHYQHLRAEVRLASGDAPDLKRFDPAMRHLIDTYIKAGDSERITSLDDLSLIQLIIDRGEAFVEAVPAPLASRREAMAENIENNLRRLIIDEQPINPRYYERMSQLLDALIAERRQQTIEYQEYLARIVELTRQASQPGGASDEYPQSLDTAGKRALYDALDGDEQTALAVHEAILSVRKDGWRGNRVKEREVRAAIRATGIAEDRASYLFDLVKQDQHRHEY